MKKKDELFLKRVKAELLSELEEISRLLVQFADFRRRYEANKDSDLLRVNASYLADFYMGAEKIFATIAEELNGGVPKGDGWHKRLLHSMSLEVKGVRPAVISDALYKDMLKFLGFRHVVRQAYGFQLDAIRLAELVKILKKTSKRFEQEIKRFCAFLDAGS